MLARSLLSLLCASVALYTPARDPVPSRAAASAAAAAAAAAVACCHTALSLPLCFSLYACASTLLYVCIARVTCDYERSCVRQRTGQSSERAPKLRGLDLACKELGFSVSTNKPARREDGLHDKGK